MAEDVVISGFGDEGRIPDFATEKTQREIKALMSKSFEGMTPADAQKLIAAIAKGDSDTNRLLKDLKLGEDSSSKAAYKKLNDINKNLENQINQDKKNERERDKDAEDQKGILKEFNKVLNNVTSGIEDNSISVIDGLGAALAGATAVIRHAAAPIATAVTAVVALSKATNSFAIQVGQERYDFANEMRQRGLTTGLDEADRSMVGFANLVNSASFTIGQATEMMRTYSLAVGDIGIDRALGFVEELAFAGADGADMMRRFGLEFQQVSNVAGEYLETVRNLGMLDRMNNQQLRAGMENFMETVSVTSNVLKVSIEDAAGMIAQTLNQRDDLTAQLAMLSDTERQDVTAIVGALGAQGTVVEEALASFLATGGGANFRLTDIAQEMQGSFFGAQMMPIIEAAGAAIQAGASQGEVIAQLGPQLEGLINANRTQFGETMAATGDDQLFVRAVAQITRNMGRYEDAALGVQTDTTQISGDDREYAESAIVRQRGEVGIERVLNQFAESFNYAENLGELNDANLRLINEMTNVAVPAVAAVAPTLGEITTEVEEQLMNLGSAGAELAGVVLDLIPEARRMRDELQAEQQAANDTVFGNGGTPGEIARTEEEREQRRIERTVGGDGSPGILGGGPVRLNYDENIARASFNLGNDVHDINGERRINSNITGRGPASFMVIPEEDYQRLVSETDTRAAMLGQAESLGVSETFANSIMNQLLLGGEDAAQDIAELLGANDTGRTFDAENSEISRNELAFLEEAIRTMNDRNMMSQEQFQEFLSVMRGTDTTGFWRREATEQREAGEIASLVAALEGLVSELRQ